MQLRLIICVLIFLSLIRCIPELDEDMPIQNQIGYDNCNGTTFTKGKLLSISDSEIKIVSKINAIGQDKIIEHGHIIKKGQVPTINNNDGITNLGSKSIASDFTSSFSGLEHSSTYYITSYIKYKSDFCLHSEFINHETPIKLFAQVRTLNFDAKANGVVDVTGAIDNTYNKEIFKYGFIYTAGNRNPDFNNAILISGENLKGINSHTFSESLNDLIDDKIYTISAFAQNDAGNSIAEPIKIHHYDFDFSKYNLPTPAFEEIIFDSFDDNTNGWFEGTANSGNIYDLGSGRYKIKTLEENGGQITFNNPENILEGLENYQIDVTIDFSSGGYDSSSGIRFEGDDSYQEYFFSIRRDSYRVGYWNNLDIYQSLDFDYYDIGSKSNTLSVRKVYGIFYLYINQELVFQFPDILFDGHSVRLRAGLNSTVYFEEFMIKKIL